MPNPADVVAYLAQAGLNQAEVMQAVYYLRNGQAPPGAVLSPKAAETINYLGAAGLDDAGVKRTDAYLSTGQDPGGPDPAPPPAPAASLAQDPAYLAFMRQLEDDDASAAATTQTRVDALNGQLNTLLPDIARQGAQERQGIDNSFESRGVLRSGARLERLGDQAQTQAGREAQARAGVAGNVADLQAQLAERRRQNAMRRSEAGLSSANRLYLQGA